MSVSNTLIWIFPICFVLEKVRFGGSAFGPEVGWGGLGGMETRVVVVGCV